MAVLTDAQLSAKVKRYTLTPHARRQAMITAVRDVERREIAGVIAECGVWMGGNIMLARMIAPERVCWLYDTFAGMTEPSEVDVSRSGKSATVRYNSHQIAGTRWCVASLDEVKAAFAEMDIFDARYLRFVVGEIEQTLRNPANLPEQIALLRLDTDWYDSTKIELEVLYPRLVSGGVLIVDDYGHWQGARKAVDDYFDGQNVVWTWIDYSGVIMTKPC